MAESRPISVRASRDVHDRVEAAAQRADVTKSEWIIAALLVQLEADESAAFHVPQVIQDAMPRRTAAGVFMPSGRIFTRERQR